MTDDYDSLGFTDQQLKVWKAIKALNGGVFRAGEIAKKTGIVTNYVCRALSMLQKFHYIEGVYDNRIRHNRAYREVPR